MIYTMKFAINNNASLPEFDLSNSRIIQNINKNLWITLEFVSRIQVMTNNKGNLG